MKYRAAFASVRIPGSDEMALKILQEEPYLSSTYQLMRGSGVSLQDSWTKIWDMLELTRVDIENILMAFAKNYEMQKESIQPKDAITYQKIRAYHYNALPEAETYLVAKVERKEPPII